MFSFLPLKDNYFIVAKHISNNIIRYDGYRVPYLYCLLLYFPKYHPYHLSIKKKVLESLYCFKPTPCTFAFANGQMEFCFI